jgi:iron complex transport system permease protein
VLLGEEAAIAVGVRIHRFRLQILVVSALLTGTLVAVAGGVGFVGLIAPHIVRLLVGPDHRRLLPVGVLLGALFLVVDLLARTDKPPSDLPLSVLTAMVGVPFFLWLLRRPVNAPGERG